MSEQERPSTSEWMVFPVPEEIWNKIVVLVKNVPGMSGDEEIVPDRSLEEMGVDSLDRIEFRMECEDEFNIHLEDEEVEKCQNLGQLASLVSWLLENGPDADEG